MQRQLLQAQTGPPTVQFGNRNQGELIIGGAGLVLVSLVALNLISRWICLLYTSDAADE